MTDMVFLTGGTGFVGSHVLGELIKADYRVKVLVRPSVTSRTASSARVGQDALGGYGQSVEAISGDVRKSGELVDHLRGCRFLIHTAAQYSFTPSDRASIWHTNVQGTRSILEAARIAGVERVVVTSSSATVGPSVTGGPADEQDWARNHGSTYHRSKLEQERAALAAQVPTLLILPTAPVGPGDWKPTPTGKMIVDFMRGRIFGSLPGGMNVVAVEDVARAHVQALVAGVDGQRYITGGQNLRLAELWKVLAHVCDRPVPQFDVPYPLALAAGLVDEARSRIIRDARPVIPLEGVRMGRELMFVSSTKAESELGYQSTPVVDALRRACQWFRENGYV